MAGEDVIISYGADLSGLKSALGELKAGSAAAGTSMKSSLTGLVAGAGIGAAIAASATLAKAALNTLGYAVQESVTFMRDSVVAALESEQANLKLARAVENAGKAFSFTFEELKNSARVLQGQSIFSNEQIESAQKVLIQYRLTGEQFRITQQLALDMAADLGTAPAQAAKILAQALADPEKAMLTLRRAGISLSETTRHQIKELVAAGDVYAAQSALLDELAAKHDGMSATVANSATGGWQQMINTLKDLQSTIGELLLPYLQEIVPVLTSLIKLFDEWARSMTNAFEVISGGNLKEFGSFMTGLKLVVDGARSELKGPALPKTGTIFDGPTGKDGLPGGRGKGGTPFRIEGESIDGLLNKDVGIGAGIADGMALALERSGLFDTLGGKKGGDIFAQQGADAQIAALAEGIKASVKASGSDVEFKSGFEDSVSTFKRIQSAQYNVNKIEERQLTALEKLVLQENERRLRDDTRNMTLLEISGTLKSGVPAVLN